MKNRTMSRAYRHTPVKKPTAAQVGLRFPLLGAPSFDSCGAVHLFQALQSTSSPSPARKVPRLEINSPGPAAPPAYQEMPKEEVVEVSGLMKWCRLDGVVSSLIRCDGRNS
jgi:hypothetical protein